MSNKQRASRAKYEKIDDNLALFQRGGKWYANIQLPNRQVRRSLRTTSKKEARFKANAIAHELINGGDSDRRNNATIEEVFNEFLEGKKCEGLAATSVKKYRFALEIAIEVANEMGRRQMSQIDARFMDRFRAFRIRQKCAQKTLFTDLIIIRGAVKFALSRKLVSADSLAGYRISKPKSKPQPFWPPEEVEQIIEACDRRPHKDIYAVLADTGMRIGELVHLTWADIDFSQNVIRVRSKEGWRTKTGNERAIPMLTRVRQIIRRQPKRLKWVFTFSEPCPNAKKSRKVSARRLLEYLKRILKKLALPGHLHTFRHSFASNAIAQRMPADVVRSILGHVDRQTLEHYTHISSKTAQAAMQALERNAYSVQVLGGRKKRVAKSSSNLAQSTA